MVIAVAESVSRTGTVSPPDLLRAFSEHYEPARGFGRGMKMALRAFEAGTPWQDVARIAWPEGSRGNGGAVRVGAIAMRCWASAEDLTRAATAATLVTHAHPEAIEASILQARLLARILTDAEVLHNPSALLLQVAAELPATVFLREAISKLRQLVVVDLEADIARACGTSTLARDSVIAAQASFLRHHGSFEEAVVSAARLGGDVDSICALVGSLAGAAYGLTAIPANWLGAMAHERSTVASLHDFADKICALLPIAFAPVSWRQ